MLAVPAQAQISGTFGINSDFRFRGRTLSAGRPVVTADVGYDDRSGLYLGAATTAVITGDDPGILNVQGNIGYATRLNRTLTLDLGVVRTQYTARLRTRPAHYTEIYSGLSAYGFSARAYYSPDYLTPGTSAVYGEIDYSVEPFANWQVSAHAGKLSFLANRPPLLSRSGYYDWRVGVSRQLGRLSAQAALSGGGPGPEYYGGTPHDRTTLVGGISFAF